MDDAERQQLRSEAATLRLLLEVNETTAYEQAERADAALEAMSQAAAAREEQIKVVHELMEASGDAVLVLHADWTLRYMNARAMASLPEGMSQGWGVGEDRLIECYPQFAGDGFQRRFHDAMTRRVPSAFEEWDPTRDLWFGVNVSPVGPGIAIFFRDVTERHRQQATLAKTEKLAAVGRLASSISHEINNPLESVVNLLYLIEHSESAGDEMRMYAQLASSELARVSHIVTQTLKFHRQSTKPQSCRISEILESVVSLFQGRLATLQVKVDREFDVEDRMLCLAGDMRQVFANLIGNAMDALGGAGTICLRTRRSREWSSGAEGLRITVADNGAGMTETTRHKLFDAFYTTKSATGTGLGLWVSHEIIRNHRGTVKVRSSQSLGRHGTVFTLFFPAHFEGSIEG